MVLYDPIGTTKHRLTTDAIEASKLASALSTNGHWPLN